MAIGSSSLCAACARNCSSRTVTLKDLVEKILREQVEPEIVVEEVKA